MNSNSICSGDSTVDSVPGERKKVLYYINTTSFKKCPKVEDIIVVLMQSQVSETYINADFYCKYG